MGKKVKSMRGEIIDFDVEQIKGQIASRPEPSTVKARQNFIDQKSRRRSKKIADQIKNLSASKVDRKVADAPTAESKKVNEVSAVEETTTTTTPKKRTIKRKTSDKEE